MTDGPTETQPTSENVDQALVTTLRKIVRWMQRGGSEGWSPNSLFLRGDELGNVASALADIIRERDRLQSQVIRVAAIVEEDPDTNPQVRRIYEVLDEV